MPDHRKVVFTSNSGLRVEAWLGRDSVKVANGYGGWETRVRPRRQALTTWVGRNPYTMDVPILLDTWRSEQQTVGTMVATLERMALPPKDFTPPPLIRVTGHIPHTDLTWVISNIEWGTQDGDEVGIKRVEGTVQLLRFVAEDSVPVSNAAAELRIKANNPTGNNQLYTIKPGDTLSTVAARELGDYKKWIDIGELNNIRDPKNVEVGQVIRIPA